MKRFLVVIRAADHRIVTCLMPSLAADGAQMEMPLIAQEPDQEEPMLRVAQALANESGETFLAVRYEPGDVQELRPE